MARIPEQVYRRLPRRLPQEWKWSNRALRFTGVNYVRVPYNASLNLSLPFTLSIWVRRRTGFVAVGTLLQKFENYHMRTDVGALIFIYFDGGAWRGWVSGIILPEEIGTHVASIWRPSGPNTEIEAFINGVSVGSAIVTGQPVTTVRDVEMGATGFLLTEYFQGDLDEPQIIDAELTPAEVLAITLRGYARVIPSTVLNLRFEEGVGLVAHDDSPFGNDGDLLPVVNPPLWINVQQFQLLAEAGV